MDFTLYRTVGKANRVALGDLATSRYYAAEKDEATGRITLVPVNIVSGGRTTADGGSDPDDADDED